MNRLLPLSLLICGGLLSLACRREAAPPSRPNIIFILADDHAAQAISAYGSRINRTPNIDRLAEQGMRLDNVFCTNGICAPSRATILTGQFSHRNGVLDNRLTFDSSQVTFPKLLQQAGYRTAAIGKWHLKSQPTGFDYWNILPGQGLYYNPVFSENGQEKTYTGYATDLCTDLALAWLDSIGGDRPFFLFLGHKAPHRNWMPGPDHLGLYQGEDIPEPPTLFDDYATRGAAAREQEMSVARHLRLAYDLKVEEAEKDEDIKALSGYLKRMTEDQRRAWRAAYAAENEAFRTANLEGAALVRWKYQRYIKDYLRCIASVDDNIGRLLDYLDRRGLAENTLVVYSSDQGFFLGEHGWYDKRFMYEESLRMPFLVRYPGVAPAGATADALAMNVDFAPTFLDFAGVDRPADWPGRSLRPVLEGATPADWRRATYYHYYEYPAEHMVKRHYGIRTGRYKLIHFYFDIDAWELYDLKEDPREIRNRYDDPAYAAVRDSLTAALRALQRQYGEDPAVFSRDLTPATLDHLGRGARVTYDRAPDPRYAAAALTDGQHWSYNRYAPIQLGDWLGWRGGSVTLTVDLGAVREIGQVRLNCYQLPQALVYYPERIDASLSDDGRDFRSIGGTTTMDNRFQEGVEQYVIDLPPARGRYIRLRVNSAEGITGGLPGAGQKPWLMVDEVVVAPAGSR